MQRRAEPVLYPSSSFSCNKHNFIETNEKSRQIFQVNIISSLGLTCRTGDLAEVRKAIARGEDVNEKFWTGVGKKTGLMLAVECKHNSIVKLLLEQPTLDLNLTDRDGWTALHFAASHDNVAAVKLLLADPRLNTHNHKDIMSTGYTPVMTAMVNKNVDALRELVAHPRVDLDTRDMLGRSLEDVSRLKGGEMVRILKEARQRRRVKAEERQQLENYQV